IHKHKATHKPATEHIGARDDTNRRNTIAKHETPSATRPLSPAVEAVVIARTVAAIATIEAARCKADPHPETEATKAITVTPATVSTTVEAPAIAAAVSTPEPSSAEPAAEPATTKATAEATTAASEAAATAEATGISARGHESESSNKRGRCECKTFHQDHLLSKQSARATRPPVYAIRAGS
ncbi:hypothetical protein MKK64_19160, partial [Methylobacterium sp. E-025]|uniref:hypothetical protein n=1 Tax=Methylobacterium sp. E-025 TaxID=2836561 RepID=UPI001FB9AAEB